MSRKEVPRAGLLKAALAETITNADGALARHLSVRQFHRVTVRFAAEGAAGLRHRRRGQASPRRLTPEVRARAAAPVHGPYAGLHDCPLTETLQEGEGRPLSRSAVRRLRQTLGLPATRRRRGRQVSAPGGRRRRRGAPSCHSTRAPSRGWKTAARHWPCMAPSTTPPARVWP